MSVHKLALRARFRIDDETGKLDVMRENRSVTCTNGVLEDDFEPFGVHVYRWFSKKP